MVFYFIPIFLVGMNSGSMNWIDVSASILRSLAIVTASAWAMARCAAWILLLLGPSGFALLLMMISAFFPSGVSGFPVMARTKCSLLNYLLIDSYITLIFLVDLFISIFFIIIIL